MAPCTFQRYKNEHPELARALIDGTEVLKEELKDTLKKKAKGFYYTETKTIIRKEGGKDIKTIEKYEKYALPDTGALHLLLKNIDPNWKNDDDRTYELKKRQLDIAEKKAEEAGWS